MTDLVPPAVYGQCGSADNGTHLNNHCTDLPVYIDTPFTVTFLTILNWPFVYKK